MFQGSGEKLDLEFDKARVRQANMLAKSGQALELNEKRLIFLTMARINSGDKELLTHKIGMKELTRHFGENPYARAERAARGLLRRIVFIPTEHGGFREFQWTTVAEYVPAESSETGESYVKIRLNEELAPLLLELRERYNTIPLLDVLPMESFNGQRLYEILWHDSHGGGKKILTYHITDLKFSLGMRTLETKGSKKVWIEKYKAWRDFRKMLERASAEFELHGRLRFSFDALRQGRAIKQVRFHLSIVEGDKPSLVPAKQPVLSSEESTVADELRTTGYVQDAEAFVMAQGHHVVDRAITLGRAAANRGNSLGKPVTNLPGFIQHLVVSGAASRSLKLDAAGAKKQAKRAAEQELVEMIKNAFDAFRNQAAESVLETLDKTTLEALPEMLRVELKTRKRPYVLEVLDKAGWQGTQYEIARNAYLLELYFDELPETVHDIETFIDEQQLLVGQAREVAERVRATLTDTPEI